MDALPQPHHPAPELHHLPGIHVYFRANVSFPVLPDPIHAHRRRHRLDVAPSRTAIGRMLAATKRRPLWSMPKVRSWMV
jgi:hypothetical protein